MSTEGLLPSMDRTAPHVTMGLLDHITAHSMDEDYAHVAEVRLGRGRSRRGTALGTPGLVVLAVLGLLVITAAAQTSRTAGTDAKGRAELVSQINDRRAAVDAKREHTGALQRANASLESRLLDTTTRNGELSGRLTRLGVSSGLIAVTGPGVKVVVDDAPDATSERQQVLDKDLQKLANGLWEAGAEAISINGERLTTLSSIRRAGSAITVNYRSLTRPYTVLAIGDPAGMQARFVESSSGQAWFDLHASINLEFSMTPQTSMTLPAARTRTLRFVTPMQPQEDKE